MRKRYRVLLFAALVAALAVPFGFGFSLESSDGVSGASEPAIAATMAPATMIGVDFRPTTAADSIIREIPDSAKLIAVGVALFGVAAVVRKRA